MFFKFPKSCVGSIKSSYSKDFSFSFGFQSFSTSFLWTKLLRIQFFVLFCQFEILITGIFSEMEVYFAQYFSKASVKFFYIWICLRKKNFFMCFVARDSWKPTNLQLIRSNYVLKDKSKTGSKFYRYSKKTPVFHILTCGWDHEFFSKFLATNELFSVLGTFCQYSTSWSSNDCELTKIPFTVTSSSE